MIVFQNANPTVTVKKGKVDTTAGRKLYDMGYDLLYSTLKLLSERVCLANNG